jgi:Fe-S cluster assembly protein SufD
MGFLMSLSTALRTHDASALPGRREESWRYSDLRAVVRAVPGPSPAIAMPANPAPLGAVAADAEIVVLNGVVQGPARFVATAGPARVLRLRVISHADHTAHQAELAIEAEDGAQLVVLETYEGLGEAYVCHTQLTFTLGDRAQIERVVLLDEPADAISVSQAEVAMAPGARFHQTVIATGAKLQRHETHLRHPGGGAEVRLDGLYLLDGRRQADLTTVLTHAAPDGTTDQLTKGLVRDQARGVFQGRIVVEEGADRTDARMGHHALLLNDGAEIDAKPELEIYADEVSCAHGNTVGSLDEAALFYMRSRGLPEPEAKALLMQAFIGQVIDRVGHAPAREAVQAWIAARLEGLA